MELGLLSVVKLHSPNLLSLVAAELHTYLGLIYLEQDHASHASESFTRALWIQSHCSISSPSSSSSRILTVAAAQGDNRSGADPSGATTNHKQHHSLAFWTSIAQTEHRLAAANGRCGWYPKGMAQI